MANAPVTPEVEADVAVLVDAVHELLRGPDGHGHIDHNFESQRIVLDIPKAWVVLAAWLAIKERHRRCGAETQSAFMRPANPAHIDRHIRTWARRFLWTLIHDAMHMHLHELAVRSHPFLRTAPGKQERARPDLDDGFPF